MRRGALRLLLPVLALSLWLAPRALQAQSGDEEARSLFERGVAAAREDRWSAARELFVRADRLMPHPNIRMNLAAALVHTGRLRQAAELYELILEQHAAEIGDQAAWLRRALDGVRARLGVVTIRLDGAADGDVLEVDSEAVSLVDGGAVLFTDPGDHLIEVRRGAETIATRRLTLEEGERRTLSISLGEGDAIGLGEGDAMPEPPEERSAPGATEPNWPAIAFLGGGGLALGALLYPLIRTNDIQNSEELASYRIQFSESVDSICQANEAGGGVRIPGLAELCSEANALFIAQIVLLTAGSAALIAGSVLLALQGPEVSIGPSARLRPVVAPGLVALGLTVYLGAP